MAVFTTGIPDATVYESGGSDSRSFSTFQGPAPLPISPLTQPTQSSSSQAPTGGQSLTLDATGRVPVGVAVQSLAVLTADPADIAVGQFWYRVDTSQLCVRHDAGTTKRVTLT
jgi:hypothetical protein